MKPNNILHFVVYVLIILAVISMVIPKDGVKINEELKIQFPTIAEIFFPDTGKYANISRIINSNLSNDTLVIQAIDNDLTGDTLKADAEELRKSIPKIEFPNGDRTILFPFFRCISNLKSNGKLIRVLHYGDSQIEGDRITSFFRSRLQNAFGGRGIGLIPVVDVAPSFSIKKEVSGKWKRYTGYGRKDSLVKHNKYGVMASFSRFSPIKKNSKKIKGYEAWIKLGKSNLAYTNARKYDQCRIFYSNNSDSVFTKFYADEKLVDSGFLSPADSLCIKRVKFDKPPENLRLEFKGKDSPDIYAIALDGNSGIAVDNIALRGSSGTIFTKMDLNLLKQFYDKLNVKLLILQFGGNVMPYIKTEKAYKDYGRWFCSQLRTLKRIKPDITIIVIGLSDMSIKQNGSYVTYPNLKNVRDALKQATFDAGCAYWDMYEAMGGRNSMPSWVFAEPPLASKDFVHFLPKGARIIANMFYNAFIYEYNGFIKQETGDRKANLPKINKKIIKK